MLTYGYYSIPRSLRIDPVWKSLPYTYRHVYETILANMCYKPTTQDDFGVLVHLKPGQLLITERDLVKLCDEPDIDKSLVHRALTKFKNINFSNQTSNHKKTIITITRKDILEISEPNFEPNSNQTRTTKETRNTNNNDDVVVVVVDKPVNSGKVEHIGYPLKCKTHTPDGVEIEASHEEYINYSIRSRKDWTTLEIQDAWSILCEYTAPIRNWKNFLDGIIQKNRNKPKNTEKKWKENNSKQKQEKCNESYSEEDMKESPLAKYEQVMRSKRKS